MFKNITKIINSVLILLIPLSIISCSADIVTVKDCEIDISSYDLEKYNLELKQFDFFWNQLVQNAPIETMFTDTIKGSSGLWVKYKDKSGENIPTTGYGTFHVKLTNIDQQKLYLSHGLISSAWKVWCNNELIYSEGVVAKTKQGTIERMKSGIIALPVKDGVAELFIEVSSYSFYSGGIIRPMYLGTRNNAISYYKKRGLIDFGFITFVFAIALYSLVGSIFRTSKDKSHLYLALFCLLGLMRQVCLGTIPLTIWFPEFSPALFHNIKHLGFMVSTFFAIQFFYILFKERMNKTVITILSYGTLIISALFPFFSVVYGLKISVAFQMLLAVSVIYISYVLLRSVNAKNKESLIPLAGLIIFLAFVIYDVLVANHIINGAYKQQYGFLAFALSQISYVSIRHKKTASQLEFAQQDLQKFSAYSKIQSEKKKLLLEKLQAIKLDDESTNVDALIYQLRQHIIENEVVPEQKIAVENIEKLNAEFFTLLSTRYTHLTKAETELCGYLRAGMKSKDIANIRNIAPESVKRARARLRTKLKLQPGTDLPKFLADLK